MITPTSGRDAGIPAVQGVAAIKLVQHREAAVRQAAPEEAPRPTRPRDARLVVTPARQPTEAECYGCVDWFHF